MSYSALILAGGFGSRLGYREKALIDINGRPIISFVIESLEKVADNIIISARDEAQGERLKSVLAGCKLTYDAYENIGPLAGMLSGLLACEDEYCFIAACDMPFISEKAVELLFRESEYFDAAIPRWDDGFLEPLHAVYRCRPMIRETREAIEKGETVILSPVFKLNVNYVSTDDIKKIDPDLRTFMNVNTQEDIQEVIKKRSF
ncbi:MAG: molybdenum cofactor guanylyltransferase [Candidatus Methanoperedens sp.]|nr:molybdenum cofactor guanylyltransferase [Candidatus Methanoperedens sp.]MCZ7370366.1 molybdenum cofactor guanylyltransferase [Candidatus Methanoperedens sp.]